ncbi:antibiotic biosynthesis monooxygenase family protein [Roseobacter weihaiensis]|uniref:antibiotic biosynthesis monooxygenase family protein n=1 Tax=Roseobacter weihaiensis TaxID=2763262 RepID=UPI001D099F35|nr:antibiotic biosynthesis monooxygenase [Roseobacter sp. H9]
MQALLFEVEPRAGHEDHYFDHAARLRPLLDAHTGLLFIDRYKSLVRSNIILSHSHWQDEASIAKWRCDAQHHKSQVAGRNTHFKDYRIRVFRVLQNYRENEAITTFSGDEANGDTASGADRFVTIVATKGDPFPDGGEAFGSVNFEDMYLSVRVADSRAEGSAVVLKASRTPNVTNAMSILVSRDYGMFQRDEAPQVFPSAAT